MWRLASLLTSSVLVGTWCAWPQEAAKPVETAGQGAAVVATQAGDARIPADAMKMVNPVKATSTSLAHSKKVFGYNCAMCHGKDGDGQGDLAEQMKLKLKDWRDPSSLKDMTDGELYYIIAKGKGQMPAGADQMKPEEIWTMVIYVRLFSHKATPAKAKQ